MQLPGALGARSCTRNGLAEPVSRRRGRAPAPVGLPRVGSVGNRAPVAVATVVMLVLAVVGCAKVPTDPTDLSGHPVFGSTVAQQPGETLGDAHTRVDAEYGPVPLLRIYSPSLPPSWATLKQDLGSVPIVISFKAPPGEVLSGALDDRLSTWFRQAPTHRDTYWIYFHEPENDVAQGSFTPEQFREAWQHIAELAVDQHNPNLHATMVLMCYTANPASGRDWRAYVPSAALLEVLAWDCYNHQARDGGYADPAAMLHRAVDASRSAGADWGVAELGSRLAPGDDGSERATWLTTVGDYARREGARFVTYFDSTVGGDFRLSDPASIAAWRALVTG